MASVATRCAPGTRRRRVVVTERVCGVLSTPSVVVSVISDTRVRTAVRPVLAASRPLAPCMVFVWVTVRARVIRRCLRGTGAALSAMCVPLGGSEQRAASSVARWMASSVMVMVIAAPHWNANVIVAFRKVVGTGHCALSVPTGTGE